MDVCRRKVDPGVEHGTLGIKAKINRSMLVNIII